MTPKEVFDKYKVEYKNKFEEGLVDVIYFEDDIPVFIIILSNFNIIGEYYACLYSFTYCF